MSSVRRINGGASITRRFAIQAASAFCSLPRIPSSLIKFASSPFPEAVRKSVTAKNLPLFAASSDHIYEAFNDLILFEEPDASSEESRERTKLYGDLNAHTERLLGDLAWGDVFELLRDDELLDMLELAKADEFIWRLPLYARKPTDFQNAPELRRIIKRKQRIALKELLDIQNGARPWNGQKPLDCFHHPDMPLPTPLKIALTSLPTDDLLRLAAYRDSNAFDLLFCRSPKPHLQPFFHELQKIDGFYASRPRALSYITQDCAVGPFSHRFAEKYVIGKPFTLREVKAAHDTARFDKDMRKALLRNGHDPADPKYANLLDRNETYAEILEFYGIDPDAPTSPPGLKIRLEKEQRNVLSYENRYMAIALENGVLQEPENDHDYGYEEMNELRHILHYIFITPENCDVVSLSDTFRGAHRIIIDVEKGSNADETLQVWMDSQDTDVWATEIPNEMILDFERYKERHKASLKKPITRASLFDSLRNG